jgi:hypothetical protein
MFWPTSNSLLEDCYAFFNKENKVNIANKMYALELFPDPQLQTPDPRHRESLVSQVKKAFIQLRSKESTENTHIELASITQSLSNPALEHREPTIGTKKLMVYRQINNDQRAKIEFTFDISGVKKEPQGSDSFPYDEPINDGWPRFEQNLVSSPPQGEIWRDIQAKTVAEAESDLEKKLVDSRRGLSLSGFNIDERIVIIVMPLLILAFELYLLANARILNRSITQGYLTMEPFAWIGVADD